MKSETKNWWSHNGIETGVQPFIDRELRSCKQISVLPLVHVRRLAVTLKKLQPFCDKIEVEPVWVDP